MKKSKELVKNTFIITLGKFSTQIITFLLLPLYTSKLSTSEYGNYDFVISISSFAVPFITMLLEESMFRFLIDSNDKEKKSIISLTFLYSIFSCTFLSTLAIIICHILKYELGIYIIICSIAAVFVSLMNALTRGEGNIKLYSVSNFIISALTIILNLIFILVFKMKFEGLVISTAIAQFLVSVIVFIYMKVWKYINLNAIQIGKLKEMLRYSIPLVPNTICWSVINTSDRIVIMSKLGASFSGIYSIAYKFPNIINNFYSYFNIAWRETAAKIAGDGNKSEFNEIYTNIKNILFSITICLIAVMPFTYNIFIDSSYSYGINFVPILAISVFYTSLSGFYGGIFSAFKDTKILGLTSVIAAIINLVINILLINNIGLYAAAISTLISAYVIYLYRKIKVKKFYKLEDKSVNYIIMFSIILIIYYIKCVYLDIISLIICIVISFILNRNIIYKILFKLKKALKFKAIND